MLFRSFIMSLLQILAPFTNAREYGVQVSMVAKAQSDTNVVDNVKVQIFHAKRGASTSETRASRGASASKTGGSGVGYASEDDAPESPSVEIEEHEIRKMDIEIDTLHAESGKVIEIILENPDSKYFANSRLRVRCRNLCGFQVSKTGNVTYETTPTPTEIGRAHV